MGSELIASSMLHFIRLQCRPVCLKGGSQASLVVPGPLSDSPSKMYAAKPTVSNRVAGESLEIRFRELGCSNTDGSVGRGDW